MTCLVTQINVATVMAAAILLGLPTTTKRKLPIRYQNVLQLSTSKIKIHNKYNNAVLYLQIQISECGQDILLLTFIN